MNVLDYTPKTTVLSEIFNLLGQEERLRIFLAIGQDHACVCHLEKVLGLRQAYISQQLMLLRKAGLVATERCGRHIFYSIPDPRWLEIVATAALIANIALPSFDLPEIEGCSYQSCSSK